MCGLRGTGYLVTLVERKSRFVLFAYIPTKETHVVMAKIAELLRPLPKNMRRTVTFDNGKEFAAHEWLSAVIGIEVYFAKPFHSWERGTNENRNRVVRMVLPKGSSFLAISGEQNARIEFLLNSRPIATLKYRKPREIFTAAVKRMQRA